MFVETYRFEEPLLGGGSRLGNDRIPYPRISDSDWKIWTAALPIRTEIDTKFLDGTSPQLYRETLPRKVRDELRMANSFFDRVEVWGKREVEKDPIAVGYQGGDRYLVVRWGMEKLIPFGLLAKRLSLMLALKRAFGGLALLAALTGTGYLIL
jgi:hypothetical protein